MMLNPPIKIALASLVAATLLTGCGGGGGASSGTPVAPVSFDGTAAKGLIAGGKVEVFEVVNGRISTTATQIFTQDRATGACDKTLVPKVDTDTVALGTPGKFRFCMPATSNPVVIKVSHQDNAEVQDEISGAFDAMDSSFSMRSFAENASARKSVSVNPFTELTISLIPAGAFSATLVNQIVQSNILMTADVNPFFIRADEEGPNGDRLRSALTTVAQFANEQVAIANACKEGENKFVCAVRSLAAMSTSKVEANGTLVGNAELDEGVSARFSLALGKIANGTVAVSVGGPAIRDLLTQATLDPNNTFANFTSKADTLSKNPVVSAAVAEQRGSVETYAQNLLAASKAFKKYAESFEAKVQTIQNTGVDSFQMVDFVSLSFEQLCDYSKASKSFTCVTGSPVPFAKSAFPNQSGDLYHVGGQGYTLSLAGSADNYTYTITNGTRTFEGEAKFTKPSNGGLLTLKGAYPSIFGPARDQVREATVDLSFESSILAKEGLADGQTVTAGVSVSVTAPASASPAVGALKVSISGTLTMTYHKAGDELEAVSFTNGTLNYAIGGDKFAGTLSGTGKTYPVNSTNTKRQNELLAMSTTGTLTLSQGDVLTGTFGVNLSYDSVNFGAQPSNSNFATGRATATVQVFDKDRNNYGLIDASMSRLKALERSSEVKFQLGEGTAAYWVSFSETQPLDPAEVSKDYFTVDKGGSNVLLKIDSSGGFRADYNQDTKTTPEGIKNSSGVVVGSITSQYQLLIDGKVLAIGFDL